ncbi:MAG: hypothetical protein LC662_14230, partial [Rhodothermaceae bacterium]|nr:hypothetical protein [Rhodothermaceae bacterium]
MYRTDNPNIINLVELALREDIGSGDITTSAIYTGSETATGIVIAKQDGVIAGIELARMISRKVDDTLKF